MIHRSHARFLLLFLLGGSPDARAERCGKPLPEARERAHPFIKEAYRLYEAHDYDGAIGEFQNAYRIATIPDILFNIAEAYKRRSSPPADADLVSAVAYYRLYLRCYFENGAKEAPDKSKVDLEIALLAKVIRLSPPPRGMDLSPPDPPPKKSVAGRGFGRLYHSTMIGTGLGVEFAGNHTEVAYQYNASQGRYIRMPVGATGVAFAPMHVGVELGVNITRAISIGVIGRFQLVTGGNADSYQASGGMMPALGSGTHKAAGALAGLLRFKARFGSGRFHPYLHVDLGAGQIRHAFDISGAEPTTGDGRALVDYATAQQYNATPSTTSPTQINEICADHNNCIDTIALGYVLFGGGGGFWWDWASFKNGGVGLVFDVNALAAVGDQFGINVDLQLGFGVHFL